MQNGERGSPFPQLSPSLILAALTRVCHHHCPPWDIWVCSSAGKGLCTHPGAKEITTRGTLTVLCSPQPSTTAEEENCLCAFPAKTDEANLALNADGARVAVSLFNGFQKVNIYFSCKRLPFIGFREQWQSKQTIH